MGITTVAVFSEADRNMPFVKEANQAIYIGESPPSESYLDINKIIIENQDFLMGFIKKRSWESQAVEDVFQSTIVEAIRSFKNFKGDSMPRTWLCGIAMNMIKVHAKKTNSSMVVSLDDLEENYISGFTGSAHGEDPCSCYEKEEWADVVLNAFNKLPDNMKITFNEVVNYGKTYEEVAVLLDVPVGTVRSRISRAREILRKSVK